MYIIIYATAVYKTQLSQTNSRDALRHTRRVVNKGGRSEWYTGNDRRSN